MKTSVLSVDGLSVSYQRRGRAHQVLSEVGFAIAAGEAYGLVGESGCGKSTIALTLMQYLPSSGRVDNGSIQLDGDDLLALGAEEIRRLRGSRMAMVYQDPASALNPSLRVAEQIAEVYRVHGNASRREAFQAAREILARVSISDPDRVLRRYPHQLSGGQQQRVVIAMALAGNPRLLILDEPTTGLDATVEAEVLDLIEDLRTELDAAILFISHNLGLVTRICDRVGVLYAGRIVEQGDAREVFGDPRHPYTMGLVRCVPRADATKDLFRLEPIPGSLPPLGAALPGCWYEPRCPLARDRCREAEPSLLNVGEGRVSRCYFAHEVPGMLRERQGIASTAASREPSAAPLLLEIRNLRKAYHDAIACDDVSLDLRRGEVLGLVGESGSGKTTLARCLVGLIEPDGGKIWLAGKPLPKTVSRRNRVTLRLLQMVFQNPDTTLNPSHSVRYTLARAIEKLGGARSVGELMRETRLEPHHLELKPAQLSGGLRQRVAIARAFAGTPALVVCDEPVSALDVSVQAAILNLLAELEAKEDVSYIFISHDLAVVRYLADRIAVMYLGQLLEVGAAEAVLSPPQHPYTEALVSAIPTLEAGQTRERIRLEGEVPSLSKPPAGCRFHTRCPRKVGLICETEPPPWHDAGGGHIIRCHIPPADLRVLQHSAPQKNGNALTDTSAARAQSIFPTGRDDSAEQPPLRSRCQGLGQRVE